MVAQTDQAGCCRGKRAVDGSGSDGQTDALPTSGVLPGGAAVLIRVARPDDAAWLERLFYRLSPESISSYFFLPLPRQPHWAARACFLKMRERRRFS